MSVTVDVVVVCWNDKERIGTALDSVFALSEVKADPKLAHIIVSDNGSTDGSREFLRERYGDRVTIIENGANLGFAAACNRAFAVTAAPYVFLLNPDAELRDCALRAIVDFFDNHPRCGIAGSRIYNLDGTIQREAVGEFDTWTGAFLRSSAWGEWPFFRRWANGASLRDWDYGTPRRVDVVIGAAMGIRRELFAQIGFFDERFFLYHEEVDFAKRAAEAGWETWFVPASEAVHEGRASSPAASIEGRKQRSRRAYWLKHHGPWWYGSLVAALAGRYALYLGAGVGLALAARRMMSGLR